MKKFFLIVLVLIVTVTLFAPVSVLAIEFDGEKHVLANNQQNTQTNTGISTDNYDQEQNCDTLLGNPENEDSVAWLVQKLLNYIQIIGPLLVVILSSIDFAQVIIKSDDDAMAKATKKLTTRLILAASLFFLPMLVKVLLGTFGLTSDPTCGLK